MVSEPNEPIQEQKKNKIKAIPKTRQKLIDEYENNDTSELYNWLLNKKIEEMPEFQRPDPLNEPDSDSSFDPFTLLKRVPNAFPNTDPFDPLNLHKRLYNEFAPPSDQEQAIKQEPLPLY